MAKSIRRFSGGIGVVPLGADPTDPQNGDIWYRSDLNRFQLYANGTASGIAGSNTGDVTLAAVGAAPNANGATLTGQTLNLEYFDATHPGIVPLSGGGTTNFLRADGTWAAPPSGFTNPMTTLGDIIYENATPAAARLAGNTTTTRQFLRQVGNGTISAAPVWDTLVLGDIPTYAYFIEKFVDYGNGSDSTGNGTITNPWKTISFALTSITDASATKQYVIKVAPTQSTTDVGTIAWKDNISLEGTGFYDDTLITNNFSYTSGANNTAKATFSHIRFAGTFAFDFSANTGTSTNFSIDNCRFQSTATITGRGGTTIQLGMRGVRCKGAVTFNNCYFRFDAGYIDNTFTLNNGSTMLLSDAAQFSTGGQLVYGGTGTNGIQYLNNPVTVVTGSTFTQGVDKAFMLDATATSIAGTIPSAAQNQGREVTYFRVDTNSGNTVTVTPTSGTINGLSSLTIAVGEAYTLLAHPSSNDYKIIAKMPVGGGGGGYGTVLAGGSNLTGTYQGNVYVDGDATISANAIVEGDLVVKGNLSNSAGHDLTVYGSCTVQGLWKFTNSSGAAGYAAVYGDLRINSSNAWIGTNKASEHRQSANPTPRYTFSAFVFQDITYTAVAGGPNGDLISVGYTNTATAGSETVTVTGNQIIVHMQANVSTATQILAAINGSALALALVTAAITGTASNPQQANSATNLSGGRTIEQLIVYGNCTIAGGLRGQAVDDSGANGISVWVVGDFHTPSLLTGVNGPHVLEGFLELYSLDLSGDNGTNANGGNGGNLTVHGDFCGLEYVGLISNGYQVNIFSNGGNIQGTGTGTCGVGGAFLIKGRAVLGNVSLNGGGVFNGTSSDGGAGGTFICMGLCEIVNGFTASGGACDPTAGANGGAGGSFTTPGMITINNVVVNGGSGGTSNGGAAGSVRIGSASPSFGNFEIDAVGGDGTAGGGATGGTGGSIEIDGDVNAATGSINASGGGGDNGGGDAGSITISGNASANLYATGGDAGTTGSSGSGGTIEVSGNLYVTSDTVDVSGGTASNSSAGQGGTLTVHGHMSGKFIANGGVSNVSTGGAGGTVLIEGGWTFNANSSSGSAQGGLGISGGGNGGSVTVNGFAAQVGITLTVKGGNTTSGTAGNAGSFNFKGGCNIKTITASDGTGGSAPTGTITSTFGGACAVSTLTMANRTGYRCKVDSNSQCTLVMASITPKTTLNQANNAATGAITTPDGFIFTGDGAVGWKRATVATF